MVLEVPVHGLLDPLQKWHGGELLTSRPPGSRVRGEEPERGRGGDRIYVAKVYPYHLHLGLSS